MNPDGKIMAVESAAHAVHRAQAAGETVVLCHGCFDIVHPGHIRHLQHAAKQGDRLLVSITGDAVLNKGTGRPLIPQELRAENLAALDCVDWVTVNDEPTAVSLLERVRPDVFVKGREYEHNRDPRFLAERAVVERCGGRVVFSSGDVIFSSTALIAALEQSADPTHATLRELMQRHDVNSDAMDALIGTFSGLPVTVVGEVIKDTYVMCDRPDVAGESPMMTLRPLERRSFDGGAAIIALHLAAMGARPTLVTGLPRTAESQAMRQRLEAAGVQVRSVQVDQPTIEKQRFLVGATKVMKLDLGEAVTVDAAQQARMVELAEQASKGAAAAIVADFGQGLLTPAVLERLCTALRSHTPILAGDVSGRRASLMSMRSMDLICPSEAELRNAVHDYDDGLSAVVARVLHRTGSRSALITLADEGVIAFARPSETVPLEGDWANRLTADHVPALVAHPVDTLGCGDSLLAAATLTRAAGGTLVQGAILGNIAAAAQAGRLGNAVIGAAELRRGLGRITQAHLNYQPQPMAVIA